MNKIVLASLFPCFLVAASCSKKEEAPPPSTPSPYDNQQAMNAPPPGQPGPQPAPGGTGRAPPPAGSVGAPGTVAPLGTLFADPAAMQNIIAGALAGGAAAMGGLTGGEVGPIEAGIKQQAPTQAKGARADGQLMSARVGPDGHAEGSVILQPGSCYTVIGFGGLGVLDFQINLVTTPPMPPQVLAQSPAGGVAPVVGPNDQCIKNPFPLPMAVKVDMHVLKGQGMVGSQVFKK